MASPSLINSYAVYSAGTDQSTLTSPSFTPQQGDVIVVKGATWDHANGLNTPTDSQSQTYVQDALAAPSGFYGWAAIWHTTVAAASPPSQTVSVSVATAVNTRHSMVVEIWRNAKMAATPAVNSPTNGTTSPNLCSATLTTAANNSAISTIAVDENNVDPTGHVYDGSAGTVVEDLFFDGHAGGNTVHYGWYQQSVGTAGSKTIGITTPNAIKWVMVGVEIQALNTGTVTDTNTATITATGANTANATATPTFTETTTATGVNSAVGGAAPTETASLTATGVNSAVGGASTTNAASITASAVAGQVAVPTIAATFTVDAKVDHKQGSWYQLLDIRRTARLEWEMDPNVIGPPLSCPNDGEPLLPGPPSQPGIWFCKFDGWQYPRDWVRPEPPAHLYDGAADGPTSYSGLP